MLSHTFTWGIFSCGCWMDPALSCSWYTQRKCILYDQLIFLFEITFILIFKKYLYIIVSYQRKSGWCFAGGGGGKVRLHSWKCLQKPSPVCYCHKCRVITFCDYVDVTGSCNTSPSTHTIVKSTHTHGAYAVNATLPHPSNCKFRPAHRLANFQKKKFEGERKLGTFGGVELLLAFPLSAPPPPIFALFL